MNTKLNCAINGQTCSLMLDNAALQVNITCPTGASGPQGPQQQNQQPQVQPTMQG